MKISGPVPAHVNTYLSNSCLFIVSFTSQVMGHLHSLGVVTKKLRMSPSWESDPLNGPEESFRAFES